VNSTLAEQLTAWSTVAVAFLAIVALFLPWLDQRRHQQVVDRRVATGALALVHMLGVLADEMLLQSDPPSFDWVRQFVPRLSVARDRLSELASLAADGSVGVADRVVATLTAVSHTVYGLELVLTLAESARTKEKAEIMLLRFGRNHANLLGHFVKQLETVADRRALREYDQVLTRLETRRELPPDAR
jgi:hypothetical protein